MGKTLIWKFKFLLILFSASLLGCETSVHDPSEDAIKSTALIIEAIQLEDSLDNDINKARYIYLMKEVCGKCSTCFVYHWNWINLVSFI